MIRGRESSSDLSWRRLVTRLVNASTTAALVLSIVGIGVAAFAVRSGSWQAHPVLSGSMEPALSTGSVALMRRVPTSDLRVGDVVIFREPGNPDETITHRITSMRVEDGTKMYETKGDANEAKDPWTVTLRGDTSHRLATQVPYVGFAVVWLRNPDVRTTLYGVASAIVLVGFIQLFLPDQWWRRRRTEPAAQEAESTIGRSTS